MITLEVCLKGFTGSVKVSNITAFGEEKPSFKVAFFLHDVGWRKEGGSKIRTLWEPGKDYESGLYAAKIITLF